MPNLRHPRIVSTLLLALFSGAGYLVGSNAQRAQTPEPGVATTPGLVNGAAAETVTFDPKPDLAWALDDTVGVPPGSVLVHGGLDYLVDRGGVPILPPNFAAGVYTTSNVNGSPIIGVVPGPSTAELFLASREDFY